VGVIQPRWPLVIKIGQRPPFEFRRAFIVLRHDPRVLHRPDFRVSPRRATGVDFFHGRAVDVPIPRRADDAGKLENFSANKFGGIEPVVAERVEFFLGCVVGGAFSK